MSTGKKNIFVIGHKNPDTDSICSAIVYANLKSKITGNNYEPKRAGHLNAETQYVLEKCGVEAPAYVSDVGTQVRDIEIRQVQGVSGNISLKKAWNLMKNENVVTLPVTEDNKIEGLITIGDIATTYMDVYDSKILATAKTPYINILETIDGTLIVGDSDGICSEGKVLIAAANPDLMESYIEENDLVILGNRYESQLCAIEMNASCIIVCEGAKVSLTIQKLAGERGCTVISTPHDTYTVARLMNQSMPIEYFMIRDSVHIFYDDDLIEEIKGVMANNRNRDFPIIDRKGNYLGMISRRNLLNMKRKQIILVDHNEKSQAVDGIEDAEILEIIDHHRLGTIETFKPVFFRNQPLGCTATIIYQMYKENGMKIEKTMAKLLFFAIISDTLMYRSPTCTPIDQETAEELAKIAGLDVLSAAEEMFAAGSNLKGKSTEEMFYQDYKKFSVQDVTFGVGQISSMNETELDDMKNRLKPYLEKAYAEHGIDMIFFMLTNIMKQSTELIFIGNNANEMVENAFGAKITGDSCRLEGVVSRKKQLIPGLMIAIQQ